LTAPTYSWRQECRGLPLHFSVHGSPGTAKTKTLPELQKKMKNFKENV
jgi:hypothetical protein